MKITWLGHSGFRIEIADQVLLVDPWFTGNPVFDAANRDAAIAGTTAILVSHGHGDHATDAPQISKILATIGVAFATINVVGGFLVTNLMLKMFSDRKK